MGEDGRITTGEEAVAFLTDGVVYPLAVCELARAHRFHNLGGSSAGGIAAAMAAAAELARDSGVFNRLAQLPLQLGDDLLAIFQPAPGTRPLFRVLLANLSPLPSVASSPSPTGSTPGSSRLPASMGTTCSPSATCGETGRSTPCRTTPPSGWR